MFNLTPILAKEFLHSGKGQYFLSQTRGLFKWFRPAEPKEELPSTERLAATAVQIFRDAVQGNSHKTSLTGFEAKALGPLQDELSEGGRPHDLAERLARFLQGGRKRCNYGSMKFGGLEVWDVMAGRTQEENQALWVTDTLRQIGHDLAQAMNSDLPFRHRIHHTRALKPFFNPLDLALIFGTQQLSYAAESPIKTTVQLETPDTNQTKAVSLKLIPNTVALSSSPGCGLLETTEFSTALQRRVDDGSAPFLQADQSLLAYTESSETPSWAQLFRPAKGTFNRNERHWRELYNSHDYPEIQALTSFVGGRGKKIYCQTPVGVAEISRGSCDLIVLNPQSGDISQKLELPTIPHGEKCQVHLLPLNTSEQVLFFSTQALNAGPFSAYRLYIALYKDGERQKVQEVDKDLEMSRGFTPCAHGIMMHPPYTFEAITVIDRWGKTLNVPAKSLPIIGRGDQEIAWLSTHITGPQRLHVTDVNTAANSRLIEPDYLCQEMPCRHRSYEILGQTSSYLIVDSWEGVKGFEGTPLFLDLDSGKVKQPDMYQRFYGNHYAIDYDRNCVWYLNNQTNEVSLVTPDRLELLGKLGSSFSSWEIDGIVVDPFQPKSLVAKVDPYHPYLSRLELKRRVQVGHFGR